MADTPQLDWHGGPEPGFTITIAAVFPPGTDEYVISEIDPGSINTIVQGVTQMVSGLFAGFGVDVVVRAGPQFHIAADVPAD